MGMIKMLGLLKGFAFVMLSFLGAIFKNGYTKLIKGYHSYTRCPKKLKWSILVRKNWDIWMRSKYWVSETFCFVMLSILAAFLQELAFRHADACLTLLRKILEEWQNDKVSGFLLLDG